MTVEFVKDLSNSSTGASQCLVKKGEDFFVVSSVDSWDHGFETLVFPADSKGVVTNFGDVAGGVGMSREEAIAELESLK
jgi:hypothetical protein